MVTIPARGWSVTPTGAARNGHRVFQDFSLRSVPPAGRVNCGQLGWVKITKSPLHKSCGHLELAEHKGRFVWLSPVRQPGRLISLHSPPLRPNTGHGTRAATPSSPAQSPRPGLDVSVPPRINSAVNSSEFIYYMVMCSTFAVAIHPTLPILTVGVWRQPSTGNYSVNKFWVFTAELMHCDFGSGAPRRYQ